MADPLVLKFAAAMVLADEAGAPSGVMPVFSENPESESVVVTMGDWTAEFSVDDLAEVVAVLLETFAGEEPDEEAVSEELVAEMEAGESGLEGALPSEGDDAAEEMNG